MTTGDRLTLRQACSMAIGGMIGGGIFSVLGVVIELSGNIAAGAFVIAGAIAAGTAYSYARLSVIADRGGGAFTYLRAVGLDEAAAWVAWVLVLGYVFTISVYAFTFGHYVAYALELPDVFARVASVAIVAVFVGVNLRGVATSGLTEDLTVLGKLIVLGVVASVGLFSFDLERFEPLASKGVGSALIGAAVIFMAYEGFQLLLYDYEEIESPKRNVPLALFISVPAVIVIYVVVTLGCMLLVPNEAIVEEKEVAFAIAGDHAMGVIGFWLASIGAVLSTSSAINATLFATARLTRDVGKAGEFPRRLASERRGVPAVAVLGLGALAALFSLAPGIEQLVSFGSLTFLLVFAVVNVLHARRTARSRPERGLAWAAAGGCAGATTGLLVYLVTEQPLALAVVILCLAAVTTGRIAFVHRR